MMISETRFQQFLLSLARRFDLTLFDGASRNYSDNLIVVQGAQRSGTTLLYLMLTAHPQLVGLDENESGYDFPPWLVMAVNAVFGKKTVYKLLPVIWQVEKFRNLYPRCHVLWVTRHPLAVVSSMRTLWFEKEAQTWLQRFGARQLVRAAEFFPDVAALNIEKLSEAEIGAHLWVAKEKMSDVYRAAGLDVNLVRYEDLLADTEQVARRVMKLLALEWSPQVLEHHRHHGKEAHPGGTKGDKPVDRSRAKPKLNLTEDEKSVVLNICRDTMSGLEYREP